MTSDDYLAEFKADWRPLGRSQRTAGNYALYLLELVGETLPEEISHRRVKEWLANSSSEETARYRARAVRAFARWAHDNDGPSRSWWQSVPLKATPPRPQVTVSEEQCSNSIAKGLKRPSEGACPQQGQGANNAHHPNTSQALDQPPLGTADIRIRKGGTP